MNRSLEILVVAIVLAGLHPQTLCAQPMWDPSGMSGQRSAFSTLLANLSRTIAEEQSELSRVQWKLEFADQLSARLTNARCETKGLKTPFETMQRSAKDLAGSAPPADPAKDQIGSATPSTVTTDRHQAYLTAFSVFRKEVVALLSPFYDQSLVTFCDGQMQASFRQGYSESQDYTSRSEDARESESVKCRVAVSDEAWGHVLRADKSDSLRVMDELARGLEAASGPTNQLSAIPSAAKKVADCTWEKTIGEVEDAFSVRRERVAALVSETRAGWEKRAEGLRNSIDDAKAMRLQTIGVIENDQLPGFYRFALFIVVCLLVGALTRCFWLPFKPRDGQWRCGAYVCEPAGGASSPPEPNADGTLRSPRPKSLFDLFSSGAFVQVFALVIVLVTIALLSAAGNLEWSAIGTMLGTIVGYAFGRATLAR